ncbi:hypothetical protein RFI_16257, partial [Reticulomyxa filosa]
MSQTKLEEKKKGCFFLHIFFFSEVYFSMSPSILLLVLKRGSFFNKNKKTTFNGVLNCRCVATKKKLLDEYDDRSTMEWAKILGLVQNVFKNLLEECVQKQHMSENAAIYFAMMRYIHVDKKSQERWLAFHVEYLKVPNRRTSQDVLIAHLQTILNVARQMDFVGRKTNEVKVLNEIFEIVRKLATSGKGRPVKKACYMLMMAIILRGPQSMYEKLQTFLEGHVLNHLDELDKAGDALDMLIMLFEGTNNPFPFHEKRPINWLSNVRSDDDETARKNHMQTVFRAFMRGKALKVIYHRYWHRCVRVFVHLCAQNLEFAITTLLPQLFDIKKSSADQIVLGLDVISEIMRLDAEQVIGSDKIGRRSQPLLLGDRLSPSSLSSDMVGGDVRVLSSQQQQQQQQQQPQVQAQQSSQISS